jgi:hypothetical protein
LATPTYATPLQEFAQEDKILTSSSTKTAQARSTVGGIADALASWGLLAAAKTSPDSQNRQVDHNGDQGDTGNSIRHAENDSRDPEKDAIMQDEPHRPEEQRRSQTYPRQDQEHIDGFDHFIVPLGHNGTQRLLLQDLPPTSIPQIPTWFQPLIPPATVDPSRPSAATKTCALAKNAKNAKKTGQERV